MRNWGNLKIGCFNNKAQSLTELATFGSVLLLAMSFFIRYGMSYIYQQDMNMRAFRMALADAYQTDTPDSSSSLTLIKDKHIPDPRDTFGVGNVVSVQGRGDVVWGNTLQDKDKYEAKDPSALPRIKFAINQGTPHEYTTAGYNTITQADYPGGFYVKLSGSDKRALVTWDRVRSFKPEGAVEPQAMVLLPSGEKDIITELASSDKNPMKQIIRILPAGLSHGSAVTGFDVLDRQAGQINPDYFALNADLYDDGNYDGNPDVNPQNLQGVLPTEVEVKRGDRLRLEERSGSGGYYKSADNITTTITPTHKIKHNTGTDTFRETYEIKGVNKPWQTQK